MEIINRLKKTVLSLALVGFISAMFLSFLIFGLGVLSEITFENNLFLPRGYNPIRDLAITFLLISVLFFVFIVFLRTGDRIFLKGVALIPLTLTLLQSRILIIREQSGSPSWLMEYATWSEVVLSIGYFYLSLTVVLVILQFYLIWNISHLSSHKNP
jgi:hypothetical protein